MDMSVFERSYSAEGGGLYAPQLMPAVWLYAYASGITSARQVARRLVEDLHFVIWGRASGWTIGRRVRSAGGIGWR